MFKNEYLENQIKDKLTCKGMNQYLIRAYSGLAVNELDFVCIDIIKDDLLKF